MNFEFHPEAEHELVDIVLYYDRHQPGLGRRFRIEVEELINRIVENPFRWPLRERDLRRANCTSFPYYVGYAVRDEIVHILAVSHAHRDPSYWKDRN